MNEFIAQHVADLSAMVGPDLFSTGRSNRELHLHVVMVGDPVDKAEWGCLEAINKAVVEKAIQVGGTCTGEYGVGIGKRKFMQLEHGEGYQLMKQIKDVIDPKGLMNPGKIF